MMPKHLFSTRTISKDFVEQIFSLASKIEANPDQFADKCKGKILATLFFEPSTRTRLSFESAMLRLGGQFLGFTSAKVSSAVKGESIADTLRMINHYSDIAVIRHYIEGVGEIAQNFASIPVISGGTGSQEHPTQALLDLYSIKKEFKEIDNLSIGVMGDLLYGRTIPSLLFGLAKYDNINLHLIAPPALQLRKNVSLRLKENGFKYNTEENLRDIISDLDILYITRIQKERFPDPVDYERLKGVYQISAEDIKNAKDRFIILHPLPRVDEIDYTIDKTKHSRYFEQAHNGVWIRMALILIYLGID